MTALGLVVVAVLAAPAPQSSAPPSNPETTAGDETSSADVLSGAAETKQDPLTRDERPEGESEFNLGRFLLNLPGTIIEGALLPLWPVIYALDRWAIISRLIDLFTNEHRTIALLPLVNFVSLRSGVGFGGVFLYNEPFGSADRTIVFAYATTNGNRSISVSSTNRLPALNGRRLSLNASYNVSKDTPYYGLAADKLAGRSGPGKDFVLRVDAVEASAGLTLLRGDFDMSLTVAYRYRELSPGLAGGPSAPATPDNITLPGCDLGESDCPRFRKGLNYPELTMNMSYDSRDTIGRTTRGIRASLDVSITHDIDRADTGGFRFEGRFSGYIPVLPINRVVVLTAGAVAAIPTPGSDDHIPYHHLAQLGGSDRLRSYNGGRFMDRLAWWASVEYRYKIFEYGGSGNTVSAVLFFDVGNVGHAPEDLFESPPWSAGLALRADANLLALGRIQIAGGPEGVVFSFGVGELP